MITISSTALQELHSFFSTQEKKDIRIYLTPHNTLEMVLDRVRAEDSSYDVEGYTFCYSPKLMMQCAQIHLDINELGFSLTPEIPLLKPSCSPSSCASCSSSCKK